MSGSMCANTVMHDAQGETAFSAGGGSAILATITATGAIHSAYHLTSAAGPILEARPLHPQMLSQMLQQLWPAACESAPLPISGFMAPTGSFLAPIGSFLAATVVAAAGEWTLTSCFK